MKYVNEVGFDVWNREYFLLKAILYYDRLCEMEQENFILIRRNDNDGKEKSVIGIINEIAMKLTLESGVSDADFIVDDLSERPASKKELTALLSCPLSEYLSFRI
ncbi:TPA: hypothetical protein ACP7R1_003007 [Escherichia coli]|nr:hypothetical protein [Escherichia coli]